MDEGYLLPEQFLFSATTSVLIGLLMMAATRRPAETQGGTKMGQAREGEERGRGVPLDDAQRVARHYGTTIEEACYLLSIYSVEELLPERGYGLTSAAQQEIIGYSAAELPTALDLVESTMKVGEKARLAICTEALPTEDELDDLYLGMIAGGFHAYRPTARVIDGIPTTQLVLQKGSPSFAVIVPLLVPLFIIGLIAFGIVQIEAISKALLPLMIAGAVGLVALALIVRRPAEKYIERGGKLPLAAATSKKALAVR